LNSLPLIWLKVPAKIAQVQLGAREHYDNACDLHAHDCGLAS